MAATSASGADEPVPLSPRERRMLAAIEDELVSSDPEFGLRMTATTLGRARVWTADSCCAAAAAVVLVLVVIAILPPSWRAVLALVFTLGVMPFLLVWAIERHRPG
jgi:Protein of unknown function (DUF3040)